MTTTISGRVTVKESDRGLRGLLVVLYDVDPDTRPEEVIAPVAMPAGVAPATVAPPPDGLAGGDRLACVPTGDNGEWTVTLDDADFRVRNQAERRPDLLLYVLAPEEPGRSFESRVLYVSNTIRQNASRFEEYRICLPTDYLVKAGITPPSAVPDSAEPARSLVGRLKDAGARAVAVVDGTLAVARDRVEAHRARFAAFPQTLRALLATAMSAVPANVLDPGRLVGAGESPFAKSTATIRQNIQDVVNSDDPKRRAPARGFISLTQAEAAELRPQMAPDGTVPESAIAAIAAKNVPGPTSTTTFLQRADTLPLCRPKDDTHDACVRALFDGAGGSTPPPEPPVVPGSGVDAVTTADIPRFVARLLDPLTAPEEQVQIGLTPVATRDTVQASVQSLFFPPSPADVPAFHDFHQLQIAFQHTWQELIDQGLLNLAQDAYETIVELGGDPTRPDYQATSPWQALQQEGRLALRAQRLAPPPPVVRDHRNGTGTDPSTAPGGVVVTGGNVRDHRGLDDPALTAPDPVVRLPALLTELEARLRERYAFTIFAANAKERSINFGILNTFRQIWTPLSYQAGPLVKSIPLAPKQSQKVTVTRKVVKKRARKELENNLRVLKEETSETTRAEQEIASRASQKTEFSYSNTAKADYEAASDSTTTTFKQDAAKSSDDVKKSFHESVFKSAQEFRNERTTEVTAETTEETDTTETTEISNPNDEIAVTFLFYELQRRYRLHESLYRVTPVVLVAQEVPQPDQIDEAWLVAHDWILKRTILDDSFLPTLDALPQSAGAETALDQMAQNVATQRQIVAELRQELQIARTIAAVQNGLVNDAVTRRTDSGGLVGSLVSGVEGAVEGAVGAVSDLLFGGSSDANQANRQAIQDSADRAADTARDLTFRLEREVTALNALLESYTKALQAHHTQLTEIARLRVHVKENILHYMQAIWRYEPPDQRYFRLHNVPIPVIKKSQRRFHLDLSSVVAPIGPPHMALARFGGRDARAYPVECVTKVDDQLEYRPLCEMADLDTLLGFKGNYMMFPLLESNALTDYMMEPYVDRATGQLLDPSDPSGWSLDEFSDYVCCLKDQLTADEFATIKPQLAQQYQALLTAPARQDDVLVVPTNSLFIEIMPSANSAIEAYKRGHRMEDLKSVQAQVREKELANVLRASRLLAGDREDPHVDRRVVIEGGTNGVVVGDQ